METKTLQPFPEGLRSKFDVVSFDGKPGNKAWVLRDLNTQTEYELRPTTINGWDIPVGESRGPSIIVSLQPSMVAMHLSTGEYYRDTPPPSRLRLKS